MISGTAAVEDGPPERDGSEMVEQRFGPYRLVSLIGRGGMGEVYRAVDERKGRIVALKMLGAWLESDEEYRRRFRRESELAARLSSPHIIPIHDYGEIDGRLFIDMRLVEGLNLADRLATTGAFAADVAVDVTGQIASALDTAHAAGLVHRDVKPSNVLLSEDESTGGRPFAYLADFGIVRAMSGGSTSLTLTGAAMVSLEYMAPERFAGQPGDRRVDVYALACVLHECLTGQRPFPGGDLPGLLNAHLNLPPPAPSAVRPGLPVGFDEVVRRGMAKRPEDRFPSAGELADAARAVLRPVPAGPPRNVGPITVIAPLSSPRPEYRPTRVSDRAQRWWPAAAVVAVGLVVGAAVVLSGSGRSAAPASPSAAPAIATSAVPASGGVTQLADIYGPVCNQIPTSGPGSPQGMVNDPVATAASNNPLLTTFVTALKKAELIDTLNSASALTVLAPFNSAWEKIPAATLNKVLADKATLTKILTLHVSGKRMDAAGVVAAGSIKSLEGESVTVGGTATAPTFKGSGNATPANNLCGNIPTKNATVFIIDTLLMPAS